MKPGQLVMLIKRNDALPPTGAIGEVVDHCSLLLMRVVRFQAHSNLESCREDGTFCVPIKWLMPIDDHDGTIAKEDQQELDFPPLTEKELTKIGRKMLKDLEKENG